MTTATSILDAFRRALNWAKVVEFDSPCAVEFFPLPLRVEQKKIDLGMKSNLVRIINEILKNAQQHKMYICDPFFELSSISAIA